ncbi:MAG: tRNA lysidine(34) synthetase TilS [Holosporaceae bacterium]|jgi:tRNA(Ile)-lysidine synthase|nr:tRNA lysidine(34) synthetase TilS [Holosporaceae bacterium]
MIDFFCAEMDRILGFCAECFFVCDNKSICVAVSGGSDSMSLLLMSAEWSRRNNVKINCVTVDHKLRKESAMEAQFVEKFCESIGVDHTILEWHREYGNIDHGKLENLAREARYELMADFCESNEINFLLVGHTWNDQLETFEIRRSSGSSKIGLACMSQVRSVTDKVKLLRPLLYFEKKQLNDFLMARGISWKEDPMNDQDFFLRVSWRKKINCYGSQQLLSISNEIAQLGRRRNAIESAAVCFLQNFCEFSSDGYAIIEKKLLLLEGKSVQAEILKRVIWNIGGKRYASNITEDICDQILSKKLNTIGRCLLKVKKDKVFVLKENRKIYQAISNVKANIFDVFLCSSEAANPCLKKLLSHDP